MQGNYSSSYMAFNLQKQQSPFLSHPSKNLIQGPASSSMVPPTIHENFPFIIDTNQETHSFSLTGYNLQPNQRANSSDEDELSFNENPDSARQWQRVKWTDAMVRLLITALSYIAEEEVGPDNGLRKKSPNLPKKGKWKSISKAMAERGHPVSPQQCEDKFNDLNKRYKRLNEVLGRGTACEVVENPVLLDFMDHVPEKAKDEVRKILSSKHLNYEEMCSYHNGNRLHLPHDPGLQRSLRLALRSEGDLKRHLSEESKESDDLAGRFNEHGGFEENPGKRANRCPSQERFSFENSLGPFFLEENDDVFAEGAEMDAILQSNKAGNWNKLRLEEQRLHIEARMLELEREKFKWERFCRKKEREFEATRIEIERMKLENERMALELRRKEMGFHGN